ncbi:MAG: N-acetylmuramate 1-kinase [Campylobacterota bacterium]|nr:N-acetylmuramate 1-kinase [Campylobacterota bacterium]
MTSDIKLWLQSIGWDTWSIEAASNDASFRSYYRLRRPHNSEPDRQPDSHEILKQTQDERPLTYILMDSSLMPESLPPFVDVAERLLATGARVPDIIVKNIKKGYLILEDFGSTHYFDILNKKNYHTLYQKAIDEIIKMQGADIKKLPLYDEDFLRFEMKLMQEWYLEKYLKISVTQQQQTVIDKALGLIVKIVLEQPQGVFVHRDFHSRNVMLTPAEEIGIIDYQDARAGAITYDLVSLLKDCYVEFDAKEIEKLALYYRDNSGVNADNTTFLKWFDFMGLQRHIKVLGIFSRLHLRDGKSEYLKDIPLTLKYVLNAAKKYDQTQELAQLLGELV